MSAEMAAAHAKSKTKLNDQEHAALDDCTASSTEDCDADVQRDRLAAEQKQRSIHYEEVVGSCISYTPSSQPSEAPLCQGDVVQILSSWSKTCDGVIQVLNGEVSAVGKLNQEDAPESATAYFHCHNIHENMDTLMLIPCKSIQFVCNFAQSRAVDVLSANNSGVGVCLKTINPQEHSSRDDPSTGWVFERLTELSTNPSTSASRDYRLRACLQKDGKPLNLAASSNGTLSLCGDDAVDGGNDLRDPQTYFYLYKRSHLPCD